MNNDQAKLEALHGILDYLKREETVKRHRQEDETFNSRRDSFAQICSMYAIIAIFIATLGVGFLTYMHDTFAERPAGTPPKITDQVVTVSLFSSILLSISSSIALGASASPMLFLFLPSQEAMQEFLAVLNADGLTCPLVRKIRRWYRLTRESQRSTTQRETTTARANPLDSAAQLQHRTSKYRTRTTTFSLPQILSSWWSLGKAKKLPGKEFQFVIATLLVALICIVLSLISLAIAVVTFSWAELGRPVAIFMTVSFVIPFAVVAGVALIYRYTLFRWQRESKTRGEDHEAQLDVSCAISSREL